MATDSFDAAFTALSELRQARIAMATQLQRRRTQIVKAAGGVDLSQTPLDDLVRQFVAGQTEESTNAAREIAIRCCQGLLSQPTGGIPYGVD
jgi:hypothetical protein